MNELLPIAVGGSVGALLRYWIGAGVQTIAGGPFPFGTLSVNVSGCLVMGFLYVFLAERAALNAEWRAGLLIGVLGAYTTFSSFSIETLALVEAGHQLKAVLNVLGSVILCLAACWGGLVMGRLLIKA